MMMLGVFGGGMMLLLLPVAATGTPFLALLIAGAA